MPTPASRLAVYCPHCHWEPDGGAHWQCSCGHVWDTFATAAVCPRCQHRWPTTQCPPGPGGCGQLAPHADWYHDHSGLVAELLAAALPVALP